MDLCPGLLRHVPSVAFLAPADTCAGWLSRGPVGLAIARRFSTNSPPRLWGPLRPIEWAVAPNGVAGRSASSAATVDTTSLAEASFPVSRSGGSDSKPFVGTAAVSEAPREAEET